MTTLLWLSPTDFSCQKEGKLLCNLGYVFGVLHMHPVSTPPTPPTCSRRSVQPHHLEVSTCLDSQEPKPVLCSLSSRLWGEAWMYMLHALSIT